MTTTKLIKFAAKCGVDLAHEYIQLTADGDLDGAVETVFNTLNADANRPYEAIIAAQATYEVCRLVGVGNAVANSFLLSIDHVIRTSP